MSCRRMKLQARGREGWTRPAPAETTSFAPAHTLNAQVDGEGQAGRGKHSAGRRAPGIVVGCLAAPTPGLARYSVHQMPCPQPDSGG